MPISRSTRAEKWDWASKALAFAIFLPLTLRSKLRIEAVLLFLTLSAAAIIIVGGLKTVASGGGYGVLNLMVTNNSNLYESSTISTVAIALIPIILWLARFGTVFPPDWRVKAFAAGLVFACLLMPIGTEARTGLVCIGVLGLLMLRDVKRRFLYLAGAALLVAGLGPVPARSPSPAGCRPSRAISRTIAPASASPSGNGPGIMRRRIRWAAASAPIARTRSR